jgi:hypothetical protein
MRLGYDDVRELTVFPVLNITTILRVVDKLFKFGGRRVTFQEMVGDPHHCGDS